MTQPRLAHAGKTLNSASPPRQPSGSSAGAGGRVKPPMVPPAAGRLRLEPCRAGWIVRATVGLRGHSKRVWGSQARAERIGRKMVNSLLEEQRRRRAAIEIDLEEKP